MAGSSPAMTKNRKLGPEAAPRAACGYLAAVAVNVTSGSLVLRRAGSEKNA